MNFVLPHHRLVAFTVAKELVAAVAAARIRDTVLRNQAQKAARSACLNIAEAAGRPSSADKARVFGIALGETIECIAAVEIAAAGGTTSRDAERNVLRVGRRLASMLTSLARA